MEFAFLTLFTDEVFRYFLLACNGIALFIWLLTLITQNFSQMDRLWPILPMVYSWAFLYTAKTSTKPADTNRLALISFLITIWGVRLAYIFWRRGYYKWEHEDHRWEFVKKRFDYPNKKLGFHIFNFFFMAFMQNWILLGYALPMWYIQTTSQEPINKADFAVAFVYLIFYTIEAVADEQQWSFQSKKHDWLKNKKTSKYTKLEVEDFERGFLVKGLFKYCRHPNYFGDIFLWFAVYLFTVSSQLESLSKSFQISSLFNYSMFSALLMTGLFKRSVAVTEKIQAKKYPEYAEYQKQIGRLLPSFSGYVPKKN
jgi:steroid 5-alpha reductase family enzyme